MPHVHEGMLDGTGSKFGIVIARFNDFITQKLLEGALDTLVRHGVKTDDIDVYWTPGSFELPLLAKKVAGLRKHDGLIALGTVIRGGTPHFDYIASEVSKGLANVSLETEMPIVFGILTTETIEQAIERAGTKHGNKGKDAAQTAIEIVNLFKSIEP